LRKCTKGEGPLQKGVGGVLTIYRSVLDPATSKREINGSTTRKSKSTDRRLLKGGNQRRPKGGLIRRIEGKKRWG